MIPHSHQSPIIAGLFSLAMDMFSVDTQRLYRPFPFQRSRKGNANMNIQKQTSIIQIWWQEYSNEKEYGAYVSTPCFHCIGRFSVHLTCYQYNVLRLCSKHFKTWPFPLLELVSLYCIMSFFWRVFLFCLVYKFDSMIQPRKVKSRVCTSTCVFSLLRASQRAHLENRG